MSVRITNEELEEDLLRISQIVDGSPTNKDIEKHGKYSPKTYTSRFGSHNNALKSIGLEPNKIFDSDKENLIDELHILNNTTEGSPTVEDIYEQSKYSINHFYEHFGSFSEALQEANIPPNRWDEITRKDLISELKNLTEKLDKVPTKDEINYHGKYSTTPYARVFGSYKKAIIESGLLQDKRNDHIGLQIERDSGPLESFGYRKSPGHVYVLNISNNDQSGVYIGQTKQLRDRLVDHNHNFNVSIPVDGKMRNNHEFTVSGIEEITPIESEDQQVLKYHERETLRKYSSDKNVDIIAGGI